jgi:uncharacterized caspase-like protein
MLRAAVIALLIALLPSQARADGRIALLIGNEEYATEIGRLANPHNDVALLERTLKRLGFEVTIAKDASLGALTRAVNAYARRIQSAGPGAIGFFYYSGHGASDGSTNYLIPVDVKTTETGELWDQSMQLTEITRKLKRDAGNATHFVVFDACRNTLKLTQPGSRAVVQSKGFVPVAQENGMLIAYSTAEGELASDVGAGAGPYATVLAEEIVKPGTESVNMFRDVQRRVRKAIGQEPYLGFSALGDVFLGGKQDATVPQPAPPQTPDKPPVTTGAPTYEQQAELTFWSTVKDSKDPAVLQVYLDKYPSGTFADLARQLIAQAKRESEARQAEAAERAAQAQRAEAERKARDAEAAKQQDQLRQALEEARQAREALKAAEADRRAAESAAQEARRSAEAAAAVLPKEVPSPSSPNPAAAEADRRAAEIATEAARRSAEALAAVLPKGVPSPSVTEEKARPRADAALVLPIPRSVSCVDLASHRKLAGGARTNFIRKCEACEKENHNFEDVDKVLFVNACVNDYRPPDCSGLASIFKLTGADLTTFLTKCKEANAYCENLSLGRKEDSNGYLNGCFASAIQSKTDHISSPSLSPTERAAMIECSKQADKKGLHDEQRKEFRRRCKEDYKRSH